MSEQATPPATTGSGPPPTEVGALGAFYQAIRRRIVAGLIAALPIAITVFILSYLYTLLDTLVIRPVTFLVDAAIDRAGLADEGLPPWWDRLVMPAITLAAVLVILYVLGLVARSRMHRAIDWVLLRVPVVSTVFKNVRGAFQALEVQDNSANRFQRVVLVEFPHHGSKVPAFVTRSLTDAATGRVILCVYVPSTPIPTTGFMLMVPEEHVTELEWDVNETLQAVISGGLTAPPRVHYQGTTTTAPGGG